MSNATTIAVVPVYFELSWSILSTIGAANVLFGILVVGITSLSPISAVPIVTSAAGAVANGLCYYAFYYDGYPIHSRAVASAFGDILWMVQEAGLSFYSFVILRRVLRNRQWWIFASLFWTIILAIVVLRVMIVVTRVRYILSNDADLQETVNHMHIGYFTSIALLEILSSYFLLTIFASAKKTSLKSSNSSGLFHYLMRSTECRLALLAILGTMRAITYSFQTTAQSATTTASQLDRFAYTMECLFPVVMFIDILASKLASSNHVYGSSSHSRPGPKSHARQFTTRKTEFGTSTMQGENVVEVQGGPGNLTSSQERIIERGSSGTTQSDIDLEAMDPHRIGISKTVEFAVYDTDNHVRTE